MGRAARSKSAVKVRQPLPKVVVKARSSHERDALKRWCSQLLDELNVKELDFTSEDMAEGKGLSVMAEGEYQVGVVTEITPDLLAEGIAREIVRRLQTTRKAKGLEIADHIVTYYYGGDQIDSVMTKFADYIKQETLSIELVKSAGKAIESRPGNKGQLFVETFKLSGIEVTLGIQKVD
jgi:isoleucyl-tRNA synthetase